MGDFGNTQVCEGSYVGECIAGKGETILDINEVRWNWRRIISGMDKDNCLGIKR